MRRWKPAQQAKAQAEARRLSQSRRLAEAVRMGLENERVAQVREEFAHQAREVFARLGLLVNRRERTGCVGGKDCLAQRRHRLRTSETEDAEHVGLGDRVAAKCDELIE